MGQSIVALKRLLSRSHRNMSDLMNDPEFPFMAWRLEGAAEMAGHWMMLQEDPEAKEMGRRLLAVTSWFTVERTNKEDVWGVPAISPGEPIK